MLCITHFEPDNELLLKDKHFGYLLLTVIAIKSYEIRQAMFALRKINPLAPEFF
jgi:hypothetical protein